MRVDGVPARKPSEAVTDASTIEVDGDTGDVSRGARKLRAALETWPVAVEGALAVDVGASTGGFTQVLLEKGARRVVALDVGHDQLAPVLREDPRVIDVQGVNARELTPKSLEDASGVDERPSVVVADLSFISLTLVLPAIAGVLAGRGEAVVLVKPQFEVGRQGVREGIVTDPGLRSEAVMTVLWSAFDAGLRTRGVLPSPIPGTKGNTELLAWFGADGPDPSHWRTDVDRWAGIR